MDKPVGAYFGASADGGVPDEVPGAGSRAFSGYALDPCFRDELFRDDGTPRAACQRLSSALASIPPEELTKLQEGVHRRFIHEGITFTVLGAKEVSEQIISIDCVPRLLTASEWDHVEAGLKQRLTALNLFLTGRMGCGRCQTTPGSSTPRSLS